MVKYQHDNLSVSGNNMSIVFIFRVVDEYCLYDSRINSMITTTCSSIKEKSKVIIREKSIGSLIISNITKILVLYALV